MQGRNLAELLKSKGPLDLAAGLHIMRQVASALKASGAAGVVHRDIKPENIMLTKKGEVKVADFGLAQLAERNNKDVHLTQEGTTLGTPLYMSPEQVTGKTLDKRSDIYSFGVTCYHMFCGSPPFVGNSAMAIAVQHVNNEPPPLNERAPKLPVVMCRMINRMMAKNPGLRYPGADYVLQDIREMARGVKDHRDLSRLKLPVLEKLDARAAGMEKKTGKPAAKSGAAKATPKSAVKASSRAAAKSSGTSAGSSRQKPARPASPSRTSGASTAAGRSTARGQSETQRPSRRTTAEAPAKSDFGSPASPGAATAIVPAQDSEVTELEAPLVGRIPETGERDQKTKPSIPPLPRRADDDEEEEFVMRKAATEFEEMDLTPMVDVTFLLLIFFMITASFTLQKTIAVPPPQTDGAAATPKPMDEIVAESVEVYVDEEANFVVDDELDVSDPDDLLDILGDKLINEQRNELLVRFDRRAPHEFVVQVIDIGKEAGMQKIRLQQSEE